MVVDNINKNYVSVYLLESNDLWHARLESKFVKYPYKFVDRNSKPLDLIHTYICDMKSIPSRGGKSIL